MKIFVNRVPAEGLYLEEKINVCELDLDTDLIKFSQPVELKGRVDRITNALTVKLNIRVTAQTDCSRCLNRFEWVIDKDLTLHYPLENSDVFIDLNPQIREEIILEYPIKPLCKDSCKGLCLKCGKNKNQGGCNCGST